MKRSEPSPRDLAATSVIAAACIVGFVALVSARLDASLGRARATLSALSAGQRESPLEREADAVEQQAESLGAWVEAQTRADQSARYEALLRLAEALDVRVDRIDPTPVRRGREERVTEFGFALDATGEYERVARLLDRIERELGAAGVARFSIAPAGGADGPGRVRVTLETRHVRFEPGRAVASASGDER
ncbi:MAG: hypothetical protein D6693_00430 [Planctomycetota bacterium]|nr:MAG: hypothetical protein D6693_00430 [Planctomycetota bacterium]